jgi:hypothetical protein
MEVKRTGIFFKAKGESLTGEIDDTTFSDDEK